MFGSAMAECEVESTSTLHEFYLTEMRKWIGYAKTADGEAEMLRFFGYAREYAEKADQCQPTQLLLPVFEAVAE